MPPRLPATPPPAARPTGIPVLGAVPWGTHFCQFYANRADLLEIFAPYFRAGLDHNEHCLWIACEPDDVRVARQELRAALPDADERLRAGDVEVVSCRDWYLTDGRFDPQRVISAWDEALERALARGYDGVRVHANEAWLTRKMWSDFAGYEASLDAVLHGRPMIVLCTYPLAGSSGAEIFDVARTHQFTVARREGAWEVMETVESVAARAEVERLNVALSLTVEQQTRALEEREALYRLLAENSNDLVSLRDLDGGLVYASPSYARVLGRPPGETMEREGELVHPDDRETIRREWPRVARGGEATITVRHRHAAGHWVWLEAVCQRVPYHGRPHVLSVARDVTSRRQAEQAHLWLLESLDRVNRAIQGTTDLERMMRDVLDVVLDVFDADQVRLLYPSDPKATAWTVTLLHGRGEFARPPGQTVPWTADAIRMMERLRESDGPVQFGGGPGQQPQLDLNEAFGIRSCLSVLVHPRGDRPYQLGIGQGRYARVWTADEERLAKEIGRRLADGLTSLTTLRNLRESERGLRVSEARFRIFVDHATDAFFLHDEVGTILDANRQASVDLGYPREELVGMHTAELDVDADPERYARIAARLDAGEVVAFDTRLRHRDGSVFPAEIRARPFVEQGRRFAVSLVRDVSQRRHLEEEFRQSQKMEAVGRLAGGIAHDFNNLLTAILGYAELALQDLPRGSPTAEDVEEIRMAAERARGVTRQLLAFSRRQVLQARVVDLGEVVRGVERMLRLLVREDVAFEVRTPREPLRASIDPVQVEQVLMNLVVNARDATPAGGRIRVEVDVVPEARRHGAPERAEGYARLVVSDTGAGMPPETAARVFEPFFTTKAAEIGTGLGLSTVFGIVRQSGGHVWVDTAPGEGSAFTVLLPVTAGETEDPAEGRPLRSRDLAGLCAVVVEDEDAVRHFVADTLRRGHVEVLDFGTPGEALSALGDPHRCVDVLLTDVVLPGMSGPAMVERIRATRPELPVIFMSGYTAEEEPFAEALRRATVLLKPFGADELLLRVAAAAG